jgi:hypothetical protein
MNDATSATDPAVEKFIDHWSKSSGAERANFQSFAKDLCKLLEVPEPDPARGDPSLDIYTFEYGVKFKAADGSESPGRVDLYKKGCFVLEAKQSRLEGRPKAVPGQEDLFVTETQAQGRRSANRGWDVLMMNARRQAEEYAKALPSLHGWPPFILVCDVGHCIEVYADFTGQGKKLRTVPRPAGVPHLPRRPAEKGNPRSAQANLDAAAYARSRTPVGQGHAGNRGQARSGL